MGRATTVVLAVALFAGIFALGAVNHHSADAALFLFVLPVALCATVFGLRAGLLAALVAVALTLLWHVGGDHGLTPVGYLSRFGTFILVGSLVGRFSDQRRRLLRVLGRHQEMSLDAIATANHDGFFTTVNPAWTRILGHSREELLSRPYMDFVHPDDVASTVKEASALSEGATTTHFRNRYRCKDGSYRWLEWAAAPAPDDRLIYAIARDITAQKSAEEAVERHQQLLEHAVASRTHDLEEARLEILQRLALAAEYRDDDTHEHTNRVGRTSRLLAELLGLPDDDISLLEQAAPLHDIGKLGISDTILMKPGRLTPAEFAVMKTHTVIGARIVSGSRSSVLRLAEEISLTHHERWDGSGYPYGSKADEIPLAGRIVAVADVFDALTHERPYKQAWPVVRAVEEISRNRGSHFDPDVVDAFAQLPHHQLLAPVAAVAISAAA